MFVTLQKLALSMLQLNSIRFNSQQEVQTNGCFSSKYKSKMAEFPTQLKWRCANNVTKSAFCFVFVPTGSNWELDTYKSNVEMWTLCQWLLLFFVNFTLMLRLCTVLLPRPRPHFTDVQPTDGDYSDRWCAWSNLVSHLEQKAVCNYWSVLCCFNLF